VRRKRDARGQALKCRRPGTRDPHLGSRAGREPTTMSSVRSSRFSELCVGAVGGDAQHLSRWHPRRRSARMRRSETRRLYPPCGMRPGVRASRCERSIAASASRSARRPACPAVGAPEFGQCSAVEWVEVVLVDEVEHDLLVRAVVAGDPAARSTRRCRVAAALEQELPEDPVEQLEDRGTEPRGDPDALRRAGLDRRDKAAPSRGW
jgi:hypothetical protein